MPSIILRLFFYWLIVASFLVLPIKALADKYDALVFNGASQFVQANSQEQVQLLQQWAVTPISERLPLLLAMQAGRLGANQSKQAFIEESGVWLAVSESIVGADQPARLRFNNRLRGLINTALASHQLLADDARVRLNAVQQLQRNTPAALLPLLEQQLVNEADSNVKEALSMILANLQLQDSDARVRLAAVKRLGDSGDPQAANRLSVLLETGEADEEVRHVAAVSLRKINSQLMLGETLGHIFSGLSLGSILLLAALGLAITFGLLGIINMAHGEMLMIGAYTTYMVQIVIQQYAPQVLNYYPLLALPIAFVVTAAVGMALERSVIRHLYGRPLETLLATWGASLILMQLVRLLFGAQNVEVANPDWLTGGIQVLPNLLLPYNRLAIIVFALLVVLFTWLLLNKTRLGLNLRAVTQNRNMAACCGVKTGQVDMLAFGLGSGIAGLGGVALSQIGNVGPDLGQTYIIDSFLVVVLGGIGQLAGTVLAALGLGVISKILEPQIGAVLGKILILALIILFIQKRPQGLFALKGRGID